MCKIRIESVPCGPAPRHMRAALCGIEVEAEETWPEVPATVDRVLFKSGQQNPSGYFVQRTELCEALRASGKRNAAAHYAAEAKRGDYIEIVRDYCSKIAA